MTDPRLVRPQWRGRGNVDALTIACIEHAEHIGGHQFTVSQGSYQGGRGDINSAGTHDGGGVVDLRWCGHVGCVRALRRAGMAAWHRTPAQGPWPDHIHAVVIGHPRLAPSAARQVVAYIEGRNGLASSGKDDGPRLPEIERPVWPWPPPKSTRVTKARELLTDAVEAAAKRGKTKRVRKLRAALKALPKR